MKQLIKRISRVADCSSADAAAVAQAYRPLRSDAAAGWRPRRKRWSVPSGHFPVYVGEEMRRFAVSADLVNHPVFAKLLKRSAEVYGFDQKGVLHIPCHVADFQRVVDALRPGGRGLSADVIELVDSISPPGADELYL